MQPPRAALLLLCCASAAAGLRPPARRARAPPGQRRRVGTLRGGAAPLSAAATAIAASPDKLFNAVFGGLAATAVVAKAATSGPADGKPRQADAAARELRRRFLPVFWLLRMADWLQGPYFYEVYASKVFDGQPASLELVSRLFLAGFGSTALFGPYVGRLADARGRKLGTLCYAALYAGAAATTKSPVLWVLFAGRVLSGVGTSLLFSAPEAWLVGDAARTKQQDALGGVFGAAYAGDALVAILAGQLAAAAAAMRGPTGPFELSAGFLAAGALAAGLLWRENVADAGAAGEGPSVRDAVATVRGDRKILTVGAMQALFEGAMYIFVLQWPPALAKGVAKVFGSGAATPFGAVFSCFMVCCLLGSTTFQALAARGVRTERKAAGTMGLAAAAMTGAAVSAKRNAMASLCAAFFAFELCVGLYFPTIGTLRSKYVPEGQRAIIMNLFGIPLNMLVVGCFLSIKKLGVPGALSVAAGALALAAAAAADLARTTKGDAS